MDRARGAGGSAVARFAGSNRFCLLFSWGLRPRLYAFVRFADSAPKLNFPDYTSRIY
jgi:hypothetical protein